jgi:hypothetical protein
VAAEAIGQLGHVQSIAGDTVGSVSGNGHRTPPRPRIEVKGSGATPEEAAAIAAAIEQFMRDTAPPPAPVETAMNPWLRAGLYEGTGRDPDANGPWGEPEPWGR